MESIAEQQGQDVLRTLPGDDVRQIMWRFADRYDLQMLVQSVASGGPRTGGPAGGRGRTQHPRMDRPRRPSSLKAFDESGITGALHGSGAGRLHRGSQESGAGAGRLRAVLGGRGRRHLQPGGQPGPRPHPRARHAGAAGHVHARMPSRPSPARTARPGAAPSPHRADAVRRRRDGHARRQGAGGRMGGRQGADPPGGQARALHHQHGLRQLRDRGRGLRRPAHQGQLHGDPGSRPTRACSTAARPPRSWSTSSPPRAIRSSACACPASRIIGGYTVKDGVIVPRYSHGEIIEAVFRRTRVTVGADDLGQAALRGGAGDPLPARPLPRRREHRPGLAAVRARPAAEGGRAAPAGGRLGHRRGRASLGFAAARLFDELDPLEKRKDELLAAQGISGATASCAPVARCRRTPWSSSTSTADPRRAGRQRLEALQADPLVQFAHPGLPGQRPLPGLQALEHRPRRQHDARGGQPDGRLRHHRGLPGLPRPQVDGRPARGHLRGPRGRAAPPALGDDDERAVPGPVRRAGSPRCAASPPTGPAPAPARSPRPCSSGSGRCDHLQTATDADGGKLYHEQAPGRDLPAGRRAVLAAGRRRQILDLLELEAKGPASPVLAEGLPGVVGFLTDLCHVQGRPGRRRGRPHLRRAGVRLQSPPAAWDRRPPDADRTPATHWQPSVSTRSGADDAGPAPRPARASGSTGWKPSSGCG